MELGTFLQPAVRGALEDNIVEVRLHLDGDVNVARIKELQATLANGNVTMPYFVLVDPDTGQPIARTDASVALNPEAMIKFLSPRL
ncbi:MAG: hypothetical protein WD226_07870 [Planctomycetota bacterium]